MIAILGEYDALPGLSQEAGVAEPRPLPGDGYGHGCGHNLLGSASLLAATAVKDYLAAQGIKGRVRYYGCPAEEGGAAKGFMARAGAFSDVDIAITWHPSAFAGSPYCRWPLANTLHRPFLPLPGQHRTLRAGTASGRLALSPVRRFDECLAANYMRELHAASDARIHYRDAGPRGASRPTCPAFAKARYRICAAQPAGTGEPADRAQGRLMMLF